MDIDSILPILIPCGAIQISAQVYYIRHCWQNPSLTAKQKARYIVAMALLNLMAAAFYLLYTRRNPEETGPAGQEMEIHPQTRQGIYVLLFIAYEVMALSVTIANLSNERLYTIVMLLGLGFAAIIIQLIFVPDKNVILNVLLSLLVIALTVPAFYLDGSDRGTFLLAVVFGSNIIKLPVNGAKVWAILSVAAFLAAGSAKGIALYGGATDDEIIGAIYFNSLQFALMILALYSIKKQLVTQRRMEEAYRTLREQSRMLEELRVVEERNRIAAEIHDTVGHTLTSAAITIEAASKSLRQNPSDAEERLLQAREQVIRGLDEIRHSVRTIRDGTREDFQAEAAQIIDQAAQSSGLQIGRIIDIHSPLAPIQQRVLAQALRESLTNAMKHGGGTEVDVLMQESGGRISLTITDNGRGAENILPGSGLSIMKERIRSLGGSLQIESQPGEGFSVNLSIPVGELKGGGQDV